MWTVAHIPPTLELPRLVRLPVAAALGATGIAIAMGGVVSFRRAKTTVNPLRPEASAALVSTGVYSFTRNPMYLGFLIVLIGWAIFLSHLMAFALLPLFVLYMNRFQIIPEERVLSAKFAHHFTAYKETVRRWI
jgi:protein-S-isoprenylcysteine O-methyltransferase Ste14